MWVPVWVGSFISELLASEPFFMLFGSQRNCPSPSHFGDVPVCYVVDFGPALPCTSRRTGIRSSLAAAEDPTAGGGGWGGMWGEVNSWWFRELLDRLWEEDEWWEGDCGKKIEVGGGGDGRWRWRRNMRWGEDFLYFNVNVVSDVALIWPVK